MRVVTSILFLIVILAGRTGTAVAQNPIDVPSDLDSRVPETRDYTALVNEAFAPITASLNLRKEQEFQIIAIISGSQVMAEPLIQRFDEVEHELTQASFAESFDEAKVRTLSEQEATLLSQLISLKVFAKAKIFQVLTPNQRTLVSQHFRTRRPIEGNLGAISIY